MCDIHDPTAGLPLTVYPLRVWVVHCVHPSYPAGPDPISPYKATQDGPCCCWGAPIHSYFPELFLRRSVSKNVEFTGRSYLRYSLEEFRIMLNGYGWNDFYLLNDVNEMWKVFLSHIVLCLDELAPRKFKFKKDRPIWFTDELMELIKDKDTLMSRVLNTNDQVDRVIARNARNRTNTLNRDAKSSYIREQSKKPKAFP